MAETKRGLDNINVVVWIGYEGLTSYDSTHSSFVNVCEDHRNISFLVQSFDETV